MRKSKTEIELASMRSLYGFLLMDSKGAESSCREGLAKVPNQDMFLSRVTWKKRASSSSYVSRASSRKLMPSKEYARLS